MKLRASWIVFILLLTACNVSVTSFPPSTPGQPLAPPTEVPVTLGTPTAVALNAPKVESPALTEIQFLDEHEGWALTQTQIVRTNDGGTTWYNVTPPDAVTADATSETFVLDVLDQTHAWVQKPDFNNFPNNGLLYRTTNGGLTWTISSTPFSGGDLNFIDANHGWMLADLGVGAGSNAVAIFQTTDGGSTWTQTYSNDPNDPHAGDSLPRGGLKSGLIPLDMQTAWVTGVVYADGTVYLYRTDDGGHIWSQVTPQLPPNAEHAQLSIERDQMKFVSSTDGFLAVRISTQTGEFTTQTAVYATQDAGKTWTLTSVMIPGAGAADFLSAQEAILYNGEKFYVTRDATQTWTVVSPNLKFGETFAAMDFVDLNKGWVITADANDHRSLYRTTDGGATWLPVIP